MFLQCINELNVILRLLSIEELV